MLTAPQDTPPPRQKPGGTFLIAGVVAVMVYTLAVGIGLLQGSVSPASAYMLAAIPCVLPAVWNFSGFLLYDSNDIGMLLCGIGWGGAALALFVQHQTVAQALRQDANALSVGVPLGASTLVMGTVATILIVSGCVLSWTYIGRRARRGF